ncbi:pitrilysin family protein [Deinococcus sonorensis]|uniref:Pitrilysin family protein n=2 Tax=Deinococcus sonorensis TaxID=309891 RepID=A0AAU7UF20_9DEIO
MTPRLHRLKSGVTLLLETDPQAQTAAAGYFVRTGARDELPSEMGASHFLEHLMFKGSERLGGADLNARLDTLGGNANAYTSDEVTVYHAACLPERLPDLLDTLTELMRPALRPEDVEVERGVILEEIAMYDDQPGSRVFDRLRQRYWAGHPLGHLVLGTAQTVAALTPEQLRRNFEARYGAAQVTLVVCGQLDEAAVIAQVERLTAGWPATRFEREVQPHRPDRSLGLTLMPDERLSRVQVAVCAPGVSATDPLREAATVLSEVLGGENGRLYWALLDSGLSDSADLGHAEYTETGVFEGGFSCDPERLGEVLDAYTGVLNTLQDEGVSEAEVRRARRKLAVATLLRAETPQGRLHTLGMDLLYLGEALDPQAAVQRYEAVTLAQVQQLLAARPFDALTVVALGQVQQLEDVARRTPA